MTGTQRTACPICGKEAAEAYKPFCSKRCADVDLHRWLGEGYKVPVLESEDEVRETPLPQRPGPEGEG